MAKENTVYLYGRVLVPPNIRIDTDGNYLSGKIILHTVRRSAASKELLLQGERRWDYIAVLSKHAKLIKDRMADLEEGDMVQVKGTLCTYEKIKQFICPHCGEVINRDGVIIYVDPIFVKRCEIGVSQEEGYRLIEDSEEISNQVKIMGTLCREPQLYENPKNKQMECDFQIASNRNRHILEDNPEKRTDYPWVKAYGNHAVDYYEALHVNSTVYIDGALQARSVKREFVCEKCGEVFEAVDSAIDIIPYNLEYLKDCSLPDSNSEEKFEGGGDENGK